MGPTKGKCACKLGSIQNEYNLEMLDDKLLAKRSNEQASLRDLARFVNIEIMSSVIKQLNADLVGDPTSIYDILNSDNVETSRRVMVTDQLTQLGVDIGDLKNDFVSYQTVRKHLNECLGVSTERRGIETVGEAREVVERSRDRYEDTIQRTLARLIRQNELHVGDLSVSSSVTVSCEECTAIYQLDEFLDCGRCNC